jgi:site-specific recombinase XerD
VFLRHRAPAIGFKTSAAVDTVVARAFKRAGIASPSTGSHQFRHALASELLRRGASLGEIGDLLRHRNIQTTTIYAKVDLPALKTLAQPWFGGRP